MARKQLIKGANATRVEERIARVPADLETESSPSIFGALKALAEEEAAGADVIAAEGGKPKARREPKPRRKSSKAAGAGTAAQGASARAQDIIPTAESEPDTTPEKKAHLGPGDFNKAERNEILRCCVDYRNRLPIYLLAVQQELEVIDSVIEKCKTTAP
jgi:hypothetical protein